MIRVRATIPCALAALLLALPAVAPAAKPAPGRYTGKVAGASLAFEVRGGAIRALSFGRVVARCDDGTTRGVRLQPLPARWSVSVRGGRFGESTAIGNATRLGTLAFAGRFPTRDRARGTLRHEFLHVPSGARCDTGTLRFSARRRAGGSPATTWQVLTGSTDSGSTLDIAVSAAGDAVRPARMVAATTCGDGGSVTLDVVNPTGADAAVTAERTFSGLWRFVPPAVAGRPAASGGAVELSGRMTSTGLEGAARLTVGFEDGSWCDSGWQLFSLQGGVPVGRSLAQGISPST